MQPDGAFYNFFFFGKKQQRRCNNVLKYTILDNQTLPKQTEKTVAKN